MARRRMPDRNITLDVESLERRSMAAITYAGVQSDTLVISCDSADSNIMVTETVTAVVRPPLNVVSARAVVTPITTGTLTLTVRDLTTMTTRVFNRADIRRISITGSKGDDSINVWSTLPTTIVAGSGNDWIVTGDGDDVVYGDGGNDRIMTNGGNDTVYGESPVGYVPQPGVTFNDFLSGGAGNDKLYGGPGVDTIMGGTGNDEIFGGDADSTGNTLYGNDGDDTITSTNRNDVVDGVAGYDVANVLAGVYVLRNCENVTIAVPDDQPQTDGWSCGPNSASRLLRAYGIPVSYSEARSYAQENSNLSACSLGTTPSTVVFILNRYKPAGISEESNFGRVTQVLSKGRPVIALVGIDVVDIYLGTVPLMHYVVLNGYDAATQTVKYIDTNGAHGSWRMAQFDFNWKWFDYFSGLGAAYQLALYDLGLRKRTFIGLVG